MHCIQVLSRSTVIQYIHIYSRLGTLTILTTHINWWIILPCLVSSVVVTVLASKNDYKLLSAIIAGPVNLIVMGTGMDLEFGFNQNWSTIERSNKKMNNQNEFYKQSTLFILIWNTLLLAGFLTAWTIVTDCEKSLTHNTLYVQEWKEKVFMKEEIRSYGLYIIIGVILMAGFLNALFLFVDTKEELENVQQEIISMKSIGHQAKVSSPIPRVCTNYTIDFLLNLRGVLAPLSAPVPLSFYFIHVLKRHLLSTHILT